MFDMTINEYKRTGKRARARGKARERLFVLIFVAFALVALAGSGMQGRLAAEETVHETQDVVAEEVQAEDPASTEGYEDEVAVDMGVAAEVTVAEEMPVEDPADGYAGREPQYASATSVPQNVGGGVSMILPSAAGAGELRIKSISFQKEWSIRDALAFLGASYRKNIIPSSQVDGALTITTLYNVTFEEALDSILGYNFKSEVNGNFIKVYTADEYKKIMQDEERKTYKVFTLYYISAAEAQKLIQPVLSGSEKVQATAAAIVDFPTGESISTTTGGGDTPALNDTLVIYDYPENIEEAAKIIGRIDVRPKQVLIEATILSVRLTEDMQFGVDWQTLAGTLPNIASPGLLNISRDTSDLFRSQGTSQVNKSGGLTVGFAIDNIAGFIQAVEEVTDITVMANPKILAVNKQLGQVYIGTKIGYKNQTTQTQTSTTEQVDFLDTGTKLSFRPYIGDDGYIRMDIHPKDSTGVLNAQNVPDEQSAELVTNIIVRNGQTIVIGGLFRDKLSSKRTQVPVLGDLPLVGGAFRGKADSIERQEVVVLLTPHIIGEPGETDGDDRAEDVDRKRQGAVEQLQWLGRTRITEEYYAKAAQYYVEGDKMLAMKKLAVVLRLHPSHLDGIRLKERILEESSPSERKKLARVIMTNIEREESPMWRKR